MESKTSNRNSLFDMKQRLLSGDADDLQVRERLISKVSTVSTSYSIMSSATPRIGKKHHTMTKPSAALPNRVSMMQPATILACDLEKQAERDPSSEATESAIATPDQIKARQVPQLKLNLLPVKRYGTQESQRKQDASTQVLSRGDVIIYRQLALEKQRCQMDGCMEVANGGECDYRVCFSKGCQKTFCSKHMAPEDPDVEDDAFKNKVCVGCQERANGAFWMTIAVVVLLPLLAAFPAIILYGGDEV